MSQHGILKQWRQTTYNLTPATESTKELNESHQMEEELEIIDIGYLDILGLE